MLKFRARCHNGLSDLGSRSPNPDIGDLLTYFSLLSVDVSAPPFSSPTRLPGVFADQPLDLIHEVAGQRLAFFPVGEPQHPRDPARGFVPSKFAPSRRNRYPVHDPAAINSGPGLKNSLPATSRFPAAAKQFPAPSCREFTVTPLTQLRQFAPESLG